MKKVYLILLVVPLLLVGCGAVSVVDENQNVNSANLNSVDEPIYCTADAKLCPDGSYVGRDSNNDCQFYPCSE